MGRKNFEKKRPLESRWVAPILAGAWSRSRAEPGAKPPRRGPSTQKKPEKTRPNLESRTHSADRSQSPPEKHAYVLKPSPQGTATIVEFNEKKGQKWRVGESREREKKKTGVTRRRPSKAFTNGGKARGITTAEWAIWPRPSLVRG